MQRRQFLESSLAAASSTLLTRYSIAQAAGPAAYNCGRPHDGFL
jgi:hypothetical protein